MPQHRRYESRERERERETGREREKEKKIERKMEKIVKDAAKQNSIYRRAKELTAEEGFTVSRTK